MAPEVPIQVLPRGEWPTTLSPGQPEERPSLSSCQGQEGSSDTGRKTFLSSEGGASGQRKQRWPLTCSGICLNSHSTSRANVCTDRELGSGHTRTASSTTPQAPVRLCSQGVETLTCGKDTSQEASEDVCTCHSAQRQCHVPASSHQGPEHQVFTVGSKVLPLPPASRKLQS